MNDRGKAKKVIQILSTTDVHNRFNTWNYAEGKQQTLGSMTQISYAVNKFRQQNPNTLLVDCGDVAQDNYANLFIDGQQPDPMFVALNYIGYDSWTFGNHEFNYGPKYIDRFRKEPNCPVLCGNIYNDKGERIGRPYVIKQMDGVKIAIIGMTTPNVKFWDGSKYPGWKFCSPVEECRKAIQEIQQKHHADLIIGALHMGEYREIEFGDNVSDLVENCPEFDVVLCGHMHVLIKDDMLGPGRTLVTEPGKFGEYISRVEVALSQQPDGSYHVESKTAELVCMKDQPADSKLDALLQPYHDRGVAESEKLVGELVGGCLSKPDEIRGIAQSQIEDTAMVHLLLNTIHYAVKDRLPEGSRWVSCLSLLNPKANVEPGPIRQCDLMKIYRYENFINVVKINGRQLKEIMEWSAEYYNDFRPGDLTVSFRIERENYLLEFFENVRYDINLSKPNGSRIEHLIYQDGTPVRDNDEIYLITNSYIKNTVIDAKIYPELAPYPVEITTEHDDVAGLRELVGEYIRKVCHGRLTNEFKPNWKLTGLEFDAQYRDKAVELINNGKLVVPTTESDKHTNIASITVEDVRAALGELR